MAEATDNARTKSLSRLIAFLREGRKPYEPLMESVCDYFAPELHKDGLPKEIIFGRDSVDGYSMLALDTWSKGIPGNMVHRDSQWLNMRINVRQLAQDEEVREYCEELSESVFWGTKRSNFYEVQPNLARHAGTIGGYCFPRVNYDKGAVEFVLSDPWQTWVARDGLGQVMYAMRMVTQTVAAWASDLGRETLPKEWAKDLEDDPFRKKTLAHLVFENPQYNPASNDAGSRQWSNVYFDEAAAKVVHEDTADYGIIDWPVRLPPGWDYPSTPAMYAYVDALTNNTLTETLIRAARLAADPPMKAMAKLKGEMDLGHGGVTWIDRPEDIIEQVHKMGSYPVGDNERERVRDCLDRWFGVHYFELLTRMEGQPPTAYHIRQVSAEKATLLGPEVGSYTRRNLDPSIDVILSAEPELSGDVVQRPAVLEDWIYQRIEAGLARMGLPVNEANFEAYQRKYPVAATEAVYNGALSSIETEMVQNRRYMDGLALLGAAAQIWPEAPLVGKPDAVMRNALQAYNWSQKDIRTEDEYKRAIDAMNASSQMQEQASIMKDLSGSAQQIAKAQESERK